MCSLRNSNQTVQMVHYWLRNVHSLLLCKPSNGGARCIAYIKEVQWLCHKVPTCKLGRSVLQLMGRDEARFEVLGTGTCKLRHRVVCKLIVTM
jgi:hypothetical protein